VPPTERFASAARAPAEPPRPLVLASASAARAQLLRQAGVPFRVDAAAIDEAEAKRSLEAEGASAAEIAMALAELKARRVSARQPGALVLGADQILECGGVRFDKPADRDHAAAQLRALAGRTHELVAAAVVLRDGERLWQTVDRARLTMRPLGDAFIADYLDRVGEAALQSVGAYQLEGLGAQLFAEVEGDHFTILGLPLLPLLDFLRGHGVVPA
jgi:nucleoside triphosphate pyrophosphatase